MRLLLLVLAVLTFSCGSGAQSHPPQPPAVWVDSAFTQEERQALTRAMATWSLAVGKEWGPMRLCQHGQDCYTIASGATDDALVLIRAMSTDEELLGEAAANGRDWQYVLAYVDDIPGNRVTFLVDHMVKYKESFEAVGLHELGHILGLYHLPLKSSLMFPMSQGLTCVDITTMLEYAVFHPEVPRNKLSWTCPTDLDLHAPSERAIDYR